MKKCEHCGMEIDYGDRQFDAVDKIWRLHGAVDCRNHLRALLASAVAEARVVALEEAEAACNEVGVEAGNLVQEVAGPHDIDSLSGREFGAYDCAKAIRALAAEPPEALSAKAKKPPKEIRVAIDHGKGVMLAKVASYLRGHGFDDLAAQVVARFGLRGHVFIPYVPGTLTPEAEFTRNIGLAEWKMRQITREVVPMEPAPAESESGRASKRRSACQRLIETAVGICEDMAMGSKLLEDERMLLWRAGERIRDLAGLPMTWDESVVELARQVSTLDAIARDAVGYGHEFPPDWWTSGLEDEPCDGCGVKPSKHAGHGSFTCKNCYEARWCPKCNYPMHPSPHVCPDAAEKEKRERAAMVSMLQLLDPADAGVMTEAVVAVVLARKALPLSLLEVAGHTAKG